MIGGAIGYLTTKLGGYNGKDPGSDYLIAFERPTTAIKQSPKIIREEDTSRRQIEKLSRSNSKKDE